MAVDACRSFVIALYVWYFSIFFRCVAFFSIYKTFIVLVILQCACPVFTIWFEYLALSLLFLIACILSS
jgi:hypothetical protein